LRLQHESIEALLSACWGVTSTVYAAEKQCLKRQKNPGSAQNRINITMPELPICTIL